jgi:hypothetical protein
MAGGVSDHQTPVVLLRVNAVNRAIDAVVADHGENPVAILKILAHRRSPRSPDGVTKAR